MEIQSQLAVKLKGNGSTEEAPSLIWGFKEGFLEEVAPDQNLNCQLVQIS